jgi:hypothetical protein
MADDTAGRNHEGESDRFERSRQALRAGVLAGVVFAGMAHSAAAQQGNCYYGVTINKPVDGQLFNFDANDPVSVTIEYLADAIKDGQNLACPVAWTADYSYTTSGGKGPYTYTDSFQTQTNGSLKRKTGSRGGQVTLTALGQPTYPGSATSTIYVAGNQIANSDITNQLTQLYTNNHSGIVGFTSDLLCHIAVQESGYAQFSNITLYGQTADWPTENGATQTVPAGSYIGLLQVAVSMSNAFDWKQNGTAGNQTLNAKLGNVLNYQSSQQTANPGLPAMTAEQLEDSALVFYGGFGNRNANCQLIKGLLRLYIPVSNVWSLNQAANCVSGQGNTAEQYVTGIRNNTIPQ